MNPNKEDNANSDNVDSDSRNETTSVLFIGDVEGSVGFSSYTGDDDSRQEEYGEDGFVDDGDDDKVNGGDVAQATVEYSDNDDIDDDESPSNELPRPASLYTHPTTAIHHGHQGTKSTKSSVLERAASGSRIRAIFFTPSIPSSSSNNEWSSVTSGGEDSTTTSDLVAPVRKKTKTGPAVVSPDNSSIYTSNTGRVRVEDHVALMSPSLPPREASEEPSNSISQAAVHEKFASPAEHTMDETILSCASVAVGSFLTSPKNDSGDELETRDIEFAYAIVPHSNKSARGRNKCWARMALVNISLVAIFLVVFLLVAFNKGLLGNKDSGVDKSAVTSVSARNSNGEEESATRSPSVVNDVTPRPSPSPQSTGTTQTPTTSSVVTLTLAPTSAPILPELTLAPVLVSQTVPPTSSPVETSTMAPTSRPSVPESPTQSPFQLTLASEPTKVPTPPPSFEPTKSPQQTPTMPPSPPPTSQPTVSPTLTRQPTVYSCADDAEASFAVFGIPRNCIWLALETSNELRQLLCNDPLPANRHCPLTCNACI